MRQYSGILRQHTGPLNQSSLLTKHSEILVDLLAENRDTRRQMEHLTSRVGEALDTFYRVVDRNTKYDQRFKEFEIRLDGSPLIRLEDKQLLNGTNPFSHPEEFGLRGARTCASEESGNHSARKPF